MRIIYVTSSLPHGKGEAFVIPEVEELKRRGHEVLVVPMYPRGEVVHGDAGPLLEHAVVRPLISLEIAAAAVKCLWGTPVRALRALRLLLGSRSAKILLKNLLVYPKGLWLARLARECGTDHIHVHWAATSATVALVAGELSGLPWSITAHRFDIAEDNLLDVKAERACFVRVINERGARELSKRISSAVPPPVIHMGVALPPATERSPTSGTEPRIVVPANLLEVKGHVYLLEAVRLLKNRGVRVHVDLAGDGPLREELLRRVGELGLGDRVALLGPLPHEKLLKRLSGGAWDMLVLPSIVTPSGEREGIPVTLMEAMGSRVPVVSTTTGGVPELFEGIADPPLVSPEDPEALAGTMEALIHDHELRERLVEAGHRRVEESFAVEQVVSELLARFEACAGAEK